MNSNGFKEEMKCEPKGIYKYSEEDYKGVELGLLTEKEMERIKELCKDKLRENGGNSFIRVDKSGNRQITWAYNPDFFPEALYTVLEGRLLLLKNYSYSDWLNTDPLHNGKLLDEIKMIIERNCQESKMVKDFFEGAHYSRTVEDGEYISRRITGCTQWEQEMEKCLQSFRVPVLREQSRNYYRDSE